MAAPRLAGHDFAERRDDLMGADLISLRGIEGFGFHGVLRRSVTTASPSSSMFNSHGFRDRGELTTDEDP